MGITDKHIRMCEKAEEMQKEWKPRMGDLFYLPWGDFRQDGLINVFILQEWWPDGRGTSHININAIKVGTSHIQTLHIPAEPEILPTYGVIWLPEYEQLISIMYEKYGKLWDNNKQEWIKGE